MVREYRKFPATYGHIEVQAQPRRLVDLVSIRPLLVDAEQEVSLERCKLRISLLVLATLEISTHHAYWLTPVEATAHGR